MNFKGNGSLTQAGIVPSYQASPHFCKSAVCGLLLLLNTILLQFTPGIVYLNQPFPSATIVTPGQPVVTATGVVFQ